VFFKGGGTTSVAGTTTLSAGNFNVVDGHTLNLGTTTTWSAGVVGVGGSGGATVNIGAGDVLNVSADVSSGNWGGGLWHNQGTINRTTSSGTASFDNAVENDGVINVNSGTLSLQQGDGTGTSSGHYSAAAGATLNFSGGTHDLTSGATVNGAGSVRFGSGTAAVSAGATFNPAALNFAGGTLQLDTAGNTGSVSATLGTRSGSGSLSVSGAMSVSQFFTLQGSGTTTVGGTTTLNGTALNVIDGHTLNLGPTTNWSAGVVGVGGSGGATVNIGAADVLDISADVNSQGPGGGHWNNQGTINRTTSSGTATFFTAVSNSGTINVDSGTLLFDSGLTQTAGLTTVDAGATLGGAVALQGGTLKGAGTASGSVTNTGGTVAPGASPGKLSIGGNYAQSAGTLQAEIAGTGQGTTYDWLAVAGSVTINGGTLAIVDDASFDPAAADTFDIVTAGSTVTGSGFASVTGAYEVQTITGPPGKVRLALTSGPQAPGAPSDAPPPPTSGSSSSPPAPTPATPDDQTVRGDIAFTQGTSNDLYLACTKLDLLLIDVLPAGARTVSVTGTADLRLVGQTAAILLDGKRVGSAVIGSDGNFAAKVPAPAANRRHRARYQARVGATASQRLKLERRMVATTLTRSGSNLVLRGTITEPFARKPATINVQRFLSCRRQEKVKVAAVVPDRSGRFAVTIPVPAGARAAIYRALTIVPQRPGARPTVRTFTLPRAIDL
jgi:hypothetical protein